MAAVIPRMKPAFKVAADSPRRMRGGKITGVIIDELEPKNPWRKYRLKIIPKKINGRWYRPGEWVYRKPVYGPGGPTWIYGDHFDFMRGR